MSDKKPVWVDQDAHALLKAYSKQTKSSMVDVASRLVLERLNELSPEAGLAEAAEPVAAAPAAAPEATVEQSAGSAATTSSAPASRPKPVARTPIPADTRDVRFLGGVWLV